MLVMLVMEFLKIFPEACFACCLRFHFSFKCASWESNPGNLLSSLKSTKQLKLAFNWKANVIPLDHSRLEKLRIKDILKVIPTF